MDVDSPAVEQIKANIRYLWRLHDKLPRNPNFRVVWHPQARTWGAYTAVIITDPFARVWAMTEEFDAPTPAVESLLRMTTEWCHFQVNPGSAIELNLTDNPHINFTPGEEDTIKELRNEAGLEFSEIASFLFRRPYSSVRQKYLALQRDAGPAMQPPAPTWTQEEDTKLFDLVNRWGSQWQFISEQLPGRSWYACKRKWEGRSAIA